MSTFFGIILLFLAYNIVLGFSQGGNLPCASCAGVVCGAAPQSCELDKIPCGCCMTCARGAGEICGPFAPRCATGLQCLTAAGLFTGRPAWYQTFFKGVCVTDPTLHGLIPTVHT